MYVTVLSQHILESNHYLSRISNFYCSPKYSCLVKGDCVKEGKRNQSAVVSICAACVPTCQHTFKQPYHLIKKLKS